MKVINQQIIKYNNLRRLYSLISGHGVISRARLASITKLSKTTVSALTDELISAGYIIDSGVGEATTPGRRPNLLEVNGNKNFVAVIAWHRNLLNAALVNTTGDTVVQRELSLPEDEDYVKLIAEAIYEHLVPAAGDGRILGVCIVTPSMIDDANRQIISTVLRLRKGDKAVDRIRQAVKDYPLAILNDTACYAYAECVYSHVGKEALAFVNQSRGVGAVLINRGELLRGANGMTTQFGHFSVDRHGPVCACGNKGCLENLVGEGALAARAEEFGVSGLLSGEADVSFRTLGRLAAEGNSQAVSLLSQLAEDMAYGLGNLISLYNPRHIIIGGTGKSLGELYLMELTESLQTMGFPKFVRNVNVRFACVGEESELVGAAKYYLDQLFTFDGDMKGKLFLR